MTNLETTYPIGTVLTAAINCDRRFKNDKPGRRHLVTGYTTDGRLVTVTFTAGAARYVDVTPTKTNGFTENVELITDVKVYVDPRAIGRKTGRLSTDEVQTLVKTWKSDTRRVWVAYAG
jgi:hypothetical protein